MAELGEGLSGYLDVQDATLRAPRIEAVSNIGISNTAPQHAFSVGSNLYVSTDSSNVLTVDGNVVCEGVKVGLIEIIPSYDFAAVSNVGNVTQSTIQFANATTGFTTTANIEVGTANLFVDTVTGRVGIGKTDPGAALDVVGDVEISSNLAVSGSKFTYDNTNTTVFTGTTSAAANEIGYLDMSTSSSSNNTHVKIYIKYGQSSALGDAEYSFYIRPNSANFSLIYDYRNQNGPITPVVYRTNANDLWSGGTPGVVRFGYSIASAQNVIWRVEVQQRSGNVTFYPTNTGSAVDTTDLVQVTPAPFTRFDSNVAVSGNVGIGLTNPRSPLTVYNGEGVHITPTYTVNYSQYSILDFNYGGGTSAGTRSSIRLKCDAVNRDSGAGPFYDYGAQGKLIFQGKTNNLFSGGGNDVTYTNIMTVDGATKNVGIGTTDPGAKLTIGPTASLLFADNRLASTARNWAIRVNNTNEGDFQIGHTGSNTGGLPNFYTNTGDAKVTINKDGNVGIGTVSPGQKLDVNGNFRCSTFHSHRTGGLAKFATRQTSDVNVTNLSEQIRVNGLRKAGFVRAHYQAGTAGGNGSLAHSAFIVVGFSVLGDGTIDYDVLSKVQHTTTNVSMSANSSGYVTLSVNTGSSFGSYVSLYTEWFYSGGIYTNV